MKSLRTTIVVLAISLVANTGTRADSITDVFDVLRFSNFIVDTNRNPIANTNYKNPGR